MPNPDCKPHYQLKIDCCDHPELDKTKDSLIDAGTPLQERHCCYVCRNCGAKWKSIQDDPANVEFEHDSAFGTPSRSQVFYERIK